MGDICAQIDPRHGRAIGRKATCLARIGDFDAAIRFLADCDAGAAAEQQLEDKIAEVNEQRTAYEQVLERVRPAAAGTCIGTRDHACVQS